jgi:hypothetical protein
VRRLSLLALIAAFGCWFTPAAFAAPPPCVPGNPSSISSTHFTVTFDDTSTSTAPLTSVKAGTILAIAERAYAAYSALGFAAPATWVGGKTNVHVVDLSASKLAAYNCFGNINLDQSQVASEYSIAFSVFEEIEFASAGSIDGSVMQGTAAWAAWKSLGYPSQSTTTLGPYEMSLDCYPNPLDSTTCSSVGYENLGESRWPFYEFLAEKFGTPFMLDLVANGLPAALATKSTTLSAEYGAFTTKLLTGGWTAQPLNLSLPPVSATVQTGIATGNIAATSYGVDHLATRFIQIDRGDGKASHKCYSATLTLKVVLPAGVTSQPVFYWSQAGSTPVPLVIDGLNAKATIPWDTCKWSSHGYLSLPNTSMTFNGANFQVSGHLDVTTTEVTATPPPTPANGYGNATDVGSGAVVPTLSVFGPLLLRLPASTTRLQLVVGSSAEGVVHATLGSVDLGLRNVVPGTNVVRFTLPKGLLQRLRRTAATANLLTLTPLSADAKASGTAVSVRLAVAPAPKPKKPKK